eukprot:scaffold1305_cov192-Ochromonas_danica.AAC.1
MSALVSVGRGELQRRDVPRLGWEGERGDRHGLSLLSPPLLFFALGASPSCGVSCGRQIHCGMLWSGRGRRADHGALEREGLQSSPI